MEETRRSLRERQGDIGYTTDAIYDAALHRARSTTAVWRAGEELFRVEVVVTREHFEANPPPHRIPPDVVDNALNESRRLARQRLRGGHYELGQTYACHNPPLLGPLYPLQRPPPRWLNSLDKGKRIVIPNVLWQELLADLGPDRVESLLQDRTALRTELYARWKGLQARLGVEEAFRAELSDMIVLRSEAELPRSQHLNQPSDTDAEDHPTCMGSRRVTPERVLGIIGETNASFSDMAINALVFAEQEASGMGRELIDGEHLLLGLLRERDGVAAQVLEQLGVPPLQTVRRAVEWIVPGGGRRRPGGLGEVANTALALAVQEAQRSNCQRVDTEHVLLGLVRAGPGTAVAVLETFGVTPDMVRDRIRRRMS